MSLMIVDKTLQENSFRVKILAIPVSPVGSIWLPPVVPRATDVRADT